MGWFKKDVVEDYRKIDLIKLKDHLKNGYANLSLGWGQNNENGSVSFILDTNDLSVRFLYNIKPDNTGEKQDFDYKIPLEATKCYFGGKRYWFRCRGIKDGAVCNKRVRVLYLGNPYFTCRHCLDLSYKSRQAPSAKTAEFKLLDDYFELEREFHKLCYNIKKFYRGNPTRKYAKAIKRIRTLDDRIRNSEVLSLYKIK